jgi:hypothetical protein
VGGDGAGGEIHVAVRPCQRTASRGSSERRERRFAVEVRVAVPVLRVRVCARSSLGVRLRLRGAASAGAAKLLLALPSA